MRNTYPLILLTACVWSLSSCGADKQNASQPPPSPSPVAPQGALDPAPGGGGSPAEQAEKQKQELAANLARGIKLGEFSLTLVADDPAVVLMDSVSVDVISATQAEAARLEAMGPVKYRDSRQTGANTRRHVFRKGGRVEIKVPTIPAADTVLLWAELPAPVAGNDSRFLIVPLALDKSDPSKGAVANPISVRLTANGWVRVN